MNTGKWAYAFQAKQLQAYILDRTRMREMVGASALIDSLCGQFLDTVLDALNIKPQDCQFCRKGGAGFTLLLPEQSLAQRLQDVISLLLPQYAPGLAYVDLCLEMKDGARSLAEISAALERRAQWAQAPALPLASPFAQRAGRSARVAQCWDYGQPQDLESARKAGFGRSAAGPRQDKVAAKFDPEACYAWPLDLNPQEVEQEVEQETGQEVGQEARQTGRLFPFLQENSYLGIIHIDGNGLGRCLQLLRDGDGGRVNYVEIEYDFSQLIEEVASAAAQQACSEVLRDHLQTHGGEIYPARPLILGGDDLTMLVRADLARPFCLRFMEAFEDISENKIQAFHAKHQLLASLPPRLTACAGIAYASAKYPFYRAYETCADLCLRAKQAAKAAVRQDLSQSAVEIPSTLCWQRLTTHQSDQAHSMQVEGLGQVRLSANVYALRDNLPLPGIPAMAALQQLCEQMRTGREQRQGQPWPQLQAMLAEARPDSSDPAARVERGTLEAVSQRYERWLSVHEKRAAHSLEKFQACLQQLGEVVSLSAGARQRLPLLRRTMAGGEQIFSPFDDALTLLKLEGEVK